MSSDASGTAAARAAAVGGNGSAIRAAGKEGEPGRREHVLDAALLTFARYGYRKASMDDVARAADISRPGLYFLFSSKRELFRAAAVHALDSDVAAAERALADTGRPLHDRLIEAFDHWTGRYVGPPVREVAVVIESNPELLGPLAAEYSTRFAGLVTDALTASAPAGREGVADDVAQTLLSTATGIKYRAAGREEFLARMTTAVGLLLPALKRAPGPRATR
ncbi:TetR/AcrR family transcriptional regulator [Streptomyces sp. 8L]|uniref:TetR/AcrR family transcriptional regulator n=1 Tax=Streptomyces sp. 8L TaxID=2877242 RepID=UPI001CD73411|nr:TetR/AcrR family transcriptional regulator [Streptomyces sp. 8L]MCA1223636.1 TetR/AcrR family transcriptional regulator [Streptomyces sp. 8L]